MITLIAWNLFIFIQGTQSHKKKHGKNIIYDKKWKWKHFTRYWPFVWGIHRSPVNSPHKVQWRGALIFSLICTWVNNREAGELRRHRANSDVTVMSKTASAQIYYTDPASLSLTNEQKFVIKKCRRSADSSIKLSDSHRTQTQTSEVRWTARFSGHWVNGQHVCISNSQVSITEATKENLKGKTFTT